MLKHELDQRVWTLIDGIVSEIRVEKIGFDTDKKTVLVNDKYLAADCYLRKACIERDFNFLGKGSISPPLQESK